MRWVFLLSLMSAVAAGVAHKSFLLALSSFLGSLAIICTVMVAIRELKK